jgi:hypothetical protein
MREPFFMKLGMYIMAPELISMTDLINPSHQDCDGQSPIVARQRLSEHISAATNTCNRKILGHVIFYAVRVVSQKNIGD